MEVIGQQPALLDSLTANEAKVLAEILIELAVDLSCSNEISGLPQASPRQLTLAGSVGMETSL